MILDYFGVTKGTKALTKNGYKQKVGEDELEAEGGHDELDEEERKAFRMLAARANYMAQDDPSCQFAAKEVCRRMARPRAADFVSLKRLARFLLGDE